MGLVVNREWKMTMQTANGEKEGMLGCVEYLELEVEGVRTYAHAFVVQSAPYLSQTSFGHISINSPSILTVSMATESP